MKLKELHALMQDIEVFERPKVQLEQYPTGPDIASRMLYTIESAYGDIEGKVVLDLGTGTGMLAIGAALLGSPAVVGVDIDPDALELAQGNCEQFEDPLPIDFVLADVQQLLGSSSSSGGGGGGGGSAPLIQEQQRRRRWRLRPDTVVMNPPFGTKAAKGADLAFLRAAAALRPRSVYSLHKSSTRAHIHKVAARELGCSSAEVIAELRYSLPATMRFHKQSSVDIEVDLWRFELPDGGEESGEGGGGGSRGAGGSRGGEGCSEEEEEEEDSGDSGD